MTSIVSRSVCNICFCKPSFSIINCLAFSLQGEEKAKEKFNTIHKVMENIR